MNLVNPKWERQFKIATLELHTLELVLQEEWNNAKAKPPGKQSPVPQVPPQGEVEQANKLVSY